MTGCVRERTWRPGRPVDVLATLAAHQRGPHDPAFQIDARGRVWRTCRPGGLPATVCVSAVRGGEVTATAWGPGAEAALEAVPLWLGSEDDPSGFLPQHPVLADAFARFRTTLIGRTGLMMEALVPAILEQKVTGTEAYRGWLRLLRKFGSPAPGPAPARMRVVPAGDEWTRIPSWEYHQAGVGPQRARTIVTAGRHVAALEAAVALGSSEADRRLRAIPGIGVWTSAEVRQRVFGDPDAVSVGDYGLPHVVTYALTGERRGTDKLMLELLEPYRGQRYRACVLLLRAGLGPPRRGPRAPVRDFRSM